MTDDQISHINHHAFHKAAEWVQHVVRMLRPFSSPNPHLQAEILLLIGEQPGVDMPQLLSETGASEATCYQVIDELLERRASGEDGLGFIRATPYLFGRSGNAFTLTPPGVDIVQRILATAHPDNDQQTKRLSLDVPASLHRRFKVACSAKGVTMQSVLCRLMDDWVSEQEKADMIRFPPRSVD